MFGQYPSPISEMPMSRPSILAVAFTLFVFSAVEAPAQQQAHAGPVIQSGGAVFAVDPDLATPLDMEYKVAFEVATTPEDADQLNVTFNSVARFINMHAQAGVPREHIRTAIVVHGPAAWDLLNDAAYQERTGVANPNTTLLRELMSVGTKVILCGQTAASRGVPTDRLVDGVQVALSAMTAFAILQDDGFRVNPW